MSLQVVLDDETAIAWCNRCQGFTFRTYQGVDARELTNVLQVSFTTTCNKCNGESALMRITIPNNLVYLTLRRVCETTTKQEQQS